VVPLGLLPFISTIQYGQSSFNVIGARLECTYKSIYCLFFLPFVSPT